MAFSRIPNIRQSSQSARTDQNEGVIAAMAPQAAQIARLEVKVYSLHEVVAEIKSILREHETRPSAAVRRFVL